MKISRRAAVCAAQHYVAAHESACTNNPVDFAGPCESCPEAGKGCNFNWADIMAPLFDATGIHPCLCRTSAEPLDPLELLQNGKATINEIRASFGLGPVPGGDVLMVKKE